MKLFGALLLFLITLSVSSQNVFVDGVNGVKTVDYKQGSNKYSMFGFKLTLGNNCSASYAYTQIITTSGMITSNLSAISWNWSEITSLELDSINHILRLNGKSNMICTDVDLDTKEIANCQSNDMVNIYFKTNNSARLAVDWVLNKVLECKGKARIIN